MKSIIIDYLKDQKELIIYGCGKNGELIRTILLINGVHVDYLCDRREELWNTMIDGISCISPNEIVDHISATILITPTAGDEIYEWLSKYSFRDIWKWNHLQPLILSLNDSAKDTGVFLKRVLNNNLTLKESLSKNSRYRNVHKGKRCFVIGNGPSASEQNLELLKDEIVFTVNKISLNPQFKLIHPNYHFWADPGFFSVDNEDLSILEIMKNIPNDTECFFPYSFSNQFIRKYGLNTQIKVNYFEQNNMASDECIDFTGYIRPINTVVHGAIRLAIYMGVSEIFLLGCECTASMAYISIMASLSPPKTHSYERDESEEKRERYVYEQIPVQEYFRAQANVFDDFNSLYKVCMKQGIKMYNCTEGGLLRGIPRMRYDDALKS